MTPDTPAATERVSDLRDRLFSAIPHVGGSGLVDAERRRIADGILPVVEAELQKRDEELAAERDKRCTAEQEAGKMRGIATAMQTKAGTEIPTLRAKLKEAVEVLERLRRDHGVQRGSWWDKQIQPFLESVRDLL